jgi:hypothetical protein
MTDAGLFSREAHRRRLASPEIATRLLQGQQRLLQTAGMLGAADPVEIANDLPPLTQRRLSHGKHDPVGR